MGKIGRLIEAEAKRQQDSLMLIPSENYTYPEVHAAVGSVLMHKYAEGQPGKRYYQGNKVVDQIESYCQTQALAAFGLSPEEWGVNVQPHSGSEANLAAISALVSPGEKILSLNLPSGGHLSHGWQTDEVKISLVSKFWNVSFYGLDSKQLIDYQQLEVMARKIKPRLLISGGTAYPREIDHEQMKRIADSVGARYLADVAHEAGLIAGGANTSPFPFADVVTMTSHKTLRGPRGGLIFGRVELMPNLNRAVFPGLQGGPHLNTIAGIAIALQKAQTKPFARYAFQTVANARQLATALKAKKLKLVSGGTDKHLVLVDLRPRRANGWFVATALEEAGTILNRNSIPEDEASPFYPSGIRLGTPAVTVRGMKQQQMLQIADWIDQAVAYCEGIEIPKSSADRPEFLADFRRQLKRSSLIRKMKSEVTQLARKFPIK
jgi:glycine hydroxymethyltransferase